MFFLNDPPKMVHAVMEEADRREFLTHLIEMVEIYEEEQPNGQWLKSITFKLPIIPHDMEISLDNGSQVETVVCMSKKNSKPKDYVEIGADAVICLSILTMKKK